MAMSVENVATSVSEEALHCFVCDVAVSGRFYTLATCRTQSTKMRLIEKLGQLVGERYMVVVSEDDIICRGCANLMNTLDRLETEMSSVRGVVLRFLEKKYSLEEGELINNKSTGLSQPPQVTPGVGKTKPVTYPDNFMSRKRKAALSDLESEQENSLASSNSKTRRADKNNVWMQCDKCKYTTHYNAFMVHHIRQHVKKKLPACDFCGGEVLVGGDCARQCGQGKDVQSQSTTHQSNGQAATAETLALMPTQMEDFAAAVRLPETPEGVISTVQHPPVNELPGPSLPTIPEVPEPPEPRELTQQPDNMAIEVQDLQEGNLQQVQIENPEEDTPTAICVMDMSEENCAEEPTMLTVQKMDDDDSNAVYVQVVEVGKEDGAGATKQVLTVAEDGTVEMVEVMWDEMVTPDVETEQDINF